MDIVEVRLLGPLMVRRADGSVIGADEWRSSKTLDLLRVRRLGETIEIEAAARSFLHHQVRSMVGCLQLVGRGKWTAADLRAALEARDRAALGFNAPPDGLFFVEALYPETEPAVSTDLS